MTATFESSLITSAGCWPRSPILRLDSVISCLYCGIANATLGARLESLGISTDFCAGVLPAQTVENGIRFGLGSTLAFRRRDLQAIGGFEALVDSSGRRLSDWQPGSPRLGLKVKLSDVACRHISAFRAICFRVLFLRSPIALGAHRPRFPLLGIRCRLGLTFGLPWALLALIFGSRGAAWAWALLACTAVMRFAVAIVVWEMRASDHQAMRPLALIPVRPRR